MWELVSFVVGSIGFIILSRNSLTVQRSHGFPRFFAFEAILGLVILNAPVWFKQPFSLQQLISWALLLDSIFLALHAFWALHKYGAPDPSIQDSTRLSPEKTTRLVTQGPYRWVRHPFYDSAALLMLAISLIAANGFLFVIGVAVFCLLITRTRTEEENLVARFGGSYRTYMERTGRYLPRIGAKRHRA